MNKMELGKHLSPSSFPAFFPLQGCQRNSQSCSTPHGSPAHKTHIVPTCTHTEQNTCKCSCNAEPPGDYWKTEFSSVLLAAIPEAAWFTGHPCEFMSAEHLRICCVILQGANHASGSLTSSWIPAPDVWPFHCTRKAVMFALRNLLEFACIQV